MFYRYLLYQNLSILEKNNHLSIFIIEGGMLVNNFLLINITISNDNIVFIYKENSIKMLCYI